MVNPGNYFIQSVVSVLKAIVALVCVLILLELCARGVLYISLTDYFENKIPQPYGKMMEEAGRFSLWGLNSWNKYDPVCYFLPKDGFFRGPSGRVECPLKKSESTIRIICIGDSTTYGVAVDYYHSWPYLLERMLSLQYPGKKIEILNAGLPGAVPQQVKRIFQFHLAEYHPDIVIWRCFSSRTDTYIVDEAPNFMRSFVCRWLYELRIFRVICVLADRWSVGNRQNIPTCIFDSLTGRNRVLPRHVTGLDFDFDKVKKIALEHGTKYALQVEYLKRREDGRLYSLTEVDGKRPVVKTFDIFRENDTQAPYLENEKGVNVNNQLPDTLFVDNCHLTEKGEALTAQEVFKYIVNSGWIETFS